MKINKVDIMQASIDLYTYLKWSLLNWASYDVKLLIDARLKERCTVYTVAYHYRHCVIDI